MKKFTQIIGLVAAVAMLSSCSITLPVTATSNPVGGKVGMSSGNCYLSSPMAPQGILCFNVDASIMTAAKNGGISKISTVDYKVSNMVGIIVTHECIVTGE